MKMDGIELQPISKGTGAFVQLALKSLLELQWPPLGLRGAAECWHMHHNIYTGSMSPGVLGPPTSEDAAHHSLGALRVSALSEAKL